MILYIKSDSIQTVDEVYGIIKEQFDPYDTLFNLANAKMQEAEKEMEIQSEDVKGGTGDMRAFTEFGLIMRLQNLLHELKLVYDNKQN